MGLPYCEGCRYNGSIFEKHCMACCLGSRNTKRYDDRIDASLYAKSAIEKYCKDDVRNTWETFWNINFGGDNDMRLPAIKDVIFNKNATVVIWSDRTKTVVKCGKDDKYDPEKGLAMAISKKALGNKGNYYETFKKYLPKEEEEELYLTVKEYAYVTYVTESTVRKKLRAGLLKGAEKKDGKWRIPASLCISKE